MVNMKVFQHHYNATRQFIWNGDPVGMNNYAKSIPSSVKFGVLKSGETMLDIWAQNKDEFATLLASQALINQGVFFGINTNFLKFCQQKSSIKEDINLLKNLKKWCSSYLEKAHAKESLGLIKAVPLANGEFAELAAKLMALTQYEPIDNGTNDHTDLAYNIITHLYTELLRIPHAATVVKLATSSAAPIIITFSKAALYASCVSPEAAGCFTAGNGQVVVDLDGKGSAHWLDAYYTSKARNIDYLMHELVHRAIHVAFYNLDKPYALGDIELESLYNDTIAKSKSATLNLYYNAKAQLQETTNQYKLKVRLDNAQDQCAELTSFSDIYDHIETSRKICLNEPNIEARWELEVARILHVPFCVRYEGALLQAEMIAHAYGALAFSASISSSLEQSSFISPRLGHSSQLLNIWDIFISDHLEPALQMALDKCVP